MKNRVLMQRNRKILIILNLVLLLGYFCFSVRNKERIISDGTLLLLELAPVDPRSLMQGDYMRLSYAIAGELLAVDSTGKAAGRRGQGFCVVKPDTLGVARLQRFQEGTTPLSEGEYLIRYHKSAGQVFLGASSYFFEEGTGERYESARYGGIKADKTGNTVLVGLYDEQRRLIP